MTQARTRANGLVIPSLPQLWLTAMLRAFVELVQSVVSTLRMNWFRPARDWHTCEKDAVLPQGTNDTQLKETNLAVPQDSSLPYPHDDVSSRKRAALSGTHVPTCGLADQWFPALRDFVAPAGMTNAATPTGSFSALCRESRLAHHRDRPLSVPLIPAKAGTRSNNGIVDPLQHTRTPLWIPAFAGTSGDRAARIPART